jgi:hypothetical protein
MHATFPAHLILPDVVTLKTYGEEYKSWSSLLCSFLHPPTISPLLGLNILSTLFSKTLNLCYPLRSRAGFTPIQGKRIWIQRFSGENSLKMTTLK